MSVRASRSLKLNVAWMVRRGATMRPTFVASPSYAASIITWGGPKYQRSKLFVPMELLVTFRVRPVLPVRCRKGKEEVTNAERDYGMSWSCPVSIMSASCHRRDPSLRPRVIKLRIDSISPECQFNWGAMCTAFEGMHHLRDICPHLQQHCDLIR